MQERSMSTTRFLDLFNGIMGIAKNHCNQNIQIQNTNLITITNMPGGSLNFSLETLSKIKGFTAASASIFFLYSISLCSSCFFSISLEKEYFKWEINKKDKKFKWIGH